MNQTDGVKLFFETLAIDSDVKGGHNYCDYLKEVVSVFLKKGDMRSAFNVYEMFFDTYKIKLKGDRSFIDLLDMVKNYEEKASTLNDKQRDHYIHSVNVFLLGLAVYKNSEKYRNAFAQYSQRDYYCGGYSTQQEEFFFRWGIVSLFHDIGYPIEITYNQFRKFVDIIVNVDGKNDAMPYLDYGNFDALNRIEDLLTWEPSEEKDGVKQVANKLVPVNLLAEKISEVFNLPYDKIEKVLSSYYRDTQLNDKRPLVDHAFYSALVVLKWYGYLAQTAEMKRDVFYHPIVDCAMAILLHNFWRTLAAEPFSIGKISAYTHPMSFLIILCDEMQEWNRKAYGKLDRKKTLAEAAVINLSENEISIHYVTSGAVLEKDFAQKKKSDIEKAIQLAEMFENSITVTCSSETDIYLNRLGACDKALVPRALLGNIEAMAKTIFHNYNTNQKKLHPDKALEYPTWEAAPSTIKYANLRQAKDIFAKINLLGYITSRGMMDLKEVTSLSAEETLRLAYIEHDAWCNDRIEDGWVFGSVKDVEKKRSPYLIPFDDLSEEIKGYDVDAVNNVIPLLHSIGVKIYNPQK